MFLFRLICEILSLFKKYRYLQGAKDCRQDQLTHTAETDWLEEYDKGKGSS